MVAVSTNPTLEFPAAGMDLEATLFCGQSFAWEKRNDGWYAGVAGNRAVLARTQQGRLVLCQPNGGAFAEDDEDFWRRYFALDLDYARLHKRFCASKTLEKCVVPHNGIRVLRQPFFDTLLSFIISQNNHIPRITAIVGRLRENFGAMLPGGGYAFPTPERLAAHSREDLACLAAGFRDKYLLDAARKVAQGLVTEEKLAALPDDEARQLLCTINGVGPKVADCVLLYSQGRNSIVPMDVWMKRAMGRLFPKGMPKTAKGYEGIAQQYIFCWARENL